MMPSATTDDQVLHAAYKRTLEALERYNNWLEALQGLSIKFMALAAVGGTFSLLGMTISANVIDTLLFGVAATSVGLVLASFTPYDTSPEAIYANPSWAAFRSSFHHEQPILSDNLLSESGDFWSNLLSQRQDDWNQFSLTFRTDDLVVRAIAEAKILSIVSRAKEKLKENKK